MICRGSSQLCAEHVVFTKRIRANLGLQQSGNTSQSDHNAPPTTPPTATPAQGTEHTSTSKTGSNFDDTDRCNSGLRRSSRKRVQRVIGYGENSSGRASPLSDTIKRKKRNKISTFDTRHFRRKRNRNRLSGDSGGESDSPQAKKVCSGRANASSEEEREENMVVDLAPLDLGVRFRDEMGALNKEESELVSL